MKTTFLILFLSILLFQLSEKKKNDFKNEFKLDYYALDTLKINWYLNEPIDYKKLNNTQIKIIKTDSISEVLIGSYISLNYFFNHKRIAEMKGFQHKIDSTWLFGHSGWFMNTFKCDSKKIPLKFHLNIESSIDDFIQFFGKPTKQDSNQIFYDFSRWRAMKKMKIYIENKRVKKIEITTTNPI